MKNSNGLSWKTEPCAVHGCQNKKSYKANGLCHKHNARLYRYGRIDLIRRENGKGNINRGGYIDGRFDGKRTYEHIHIAEKALGRKLPPGALVHHVNEIRTDNTPTNLVICPNDAYHKLIHRRMEAMKATGDPNLVRCPVCKQYDEPVNLWRQYTHKRCLARAAKERYHRLKTKEST